MAGIANSHQQAAVRRAPASGARRWRHIGHVRHQGHLQDKQQQQHQQAHLQHEQRRQQRDVREVAEAGRKFGISEGRVNEGLDAMASLLPGLGLNLNLMKASDWALAVADVPRMASISIMLRQLLPTADVVRIVAATPKLLVKEPAQLRAEITEVQAMLAPISDRVDDIVEAVPQLLDPKALVQSLANLRAWFPKQATTQQGALDLLAKNPTLLLNIEEADLAADPIYDDAY